MYGDTLYKSPPFTEYFFTLYSFGGCHNSMEFPLGLWIRAKMRINFTPVSLSSFHNKDPQEDIPLKNHPYPVHAPTQNPV